ncbi:hypothetical protein [Nonomuraea sp. SYSU D8015]|uniref:hypothetical protein n=1 Tax=Nonomuraea sp. SYSU D8015 TaxID=2593644 RepID=UPI00166034D5|nr:hypothetical protein [Nonomuraea sp. SYSU D8015]
MSTRGAAIGAAVIAAAATITAALITSGQVKIGGAPGDPGTNRNTVPSGRPGESKRPNIAVTPKSLELCAGESCAKEVHILSTGTATLKIDDIEFEGDSPGDFRHDDACANQALQAEDECTLKVWFEPAVAGAGSTAVLVIHQNLPGKPTYVSLTGVGQQPTTDPTASAEPTEQSAP